MNSITRDVLVKRRGLTEVIPYIRNTNAQPLQFRFCDFTIPENARAQVYVQKPSGKAVYNSAAISENIVTVNVETQMFSEIGNCTLQLRISQGEDILVTFDQPVKVYPNFTEGDAEQSRNESGFFYEYEKRMNEVIDKANEAAENADKTAQEIQDKADNGEFDGEPGKEGPPGPEGPQGPTGNVENFNTVKAEFLQAEKRENIETGDVISTIFGKIRKYFSDLQTVAFSGKYDDLSEKPTIPTTLKNPNALTFTGAATGSYDGSAKETVHIPSGVNSLLATVTGYWLDATQGKVLNDKIAELIGNMGGMKYKVYDIPPNTRSWSKGNNSAMVIDIDYAKIKSISAALYTATTLFALPIPAMSNEGAYDISFAVSVRLSNSGSLTISCGGTWSGYGLHVVVGYTD